MLRKILREAIAPYWDPGLKDRILRAVSDYQIEQTKKLTDNIGDDEMDAIRDAITEKMGVAEQAINDLRKATAIDATEFDLDELILSEPELEGLPTRSPLLDPDHDWITQTEILVDRKKYKV